MQNKPLQCYVFEYSSEDEKYLRSQVMAQAAPIELQFSPCPLNQTNADDYAQAQAVLIFVHSRLDRTTLAQLPQLRLIITRSTGYDHIDLAAARERGITVCYAPNYGTVTVAEYAVALMLALSRRLKPLLERGTCRFAAPGLIGSDLSGKVLGLLGTGRIGAHVARLVQGFAMPILAYDTQPDSSLSEHYGVRYVDFATLLRQADILSVHVPYTAATHHFINQHNIGWLKPSAMLINTARGGVVETVAVLQALRRGELQGGVALDTFGGEEVWLGQTDLCQTLLPAETLREAFLVYQLAQFPHVIISPHNAYHSREALQRIREMAWQSLYGFLRGESIHAL